MSEALAISRDFGAMKGSELLAFPGSVSKRASEFISVRAEELITTISALLEEMVLSVVEMPTASEFAAARATIFPDYFNAVLSMSSLTQMLVPHQAMERLNREFVCELEANLRERGLRTFGAAVLEQAMFTVWTLRKISDYMLQISRAQLKNSDSQTEIDAKLVQESIFHAVRTRFHVHCLAVSMAHSKPIHSEAMESVVDGLRSVVNAYSLTRRLLDIIVPLQEPILGPVVWDDEDEALLREASFDAVFED